MVKIHIIENWKILTPLQKPENTWRNILIQRQIMNLKKLNLLKALYFILAILNNGLSFAWYILNAWFDPDVGLMSIAVKYDF